MEFSQLLMGEWSFIHPVKHGFGDGSARREHAQMSMAFEGDFVACMGFYQPSFTEHQSVDVTQPLTTAWKRRRARGKQQGGLCWAT